MINKRVTVIALTAYMVLLGVSFATASTPPPPLPPKVIVTDNTFPEPPCFHWDGFTTALTASVTNPPQSDQETTITGPRYHWNCSGPAPGFIVANGG